MSARIWPADPVTGAPSYTGRMLRQTTVAPFAPMGTSSRPLGSVSGVRPGTPSSIVTATSTTWTVTPFAGVIDGETLAIAGPYTYAFDTNQTGTVTAAGASARVDRLDVQVSDPAESDGSSTPGIAVVYTQGTPSLPAAPARSHPLAQINVPATGGGSPTVTWSASFTGSGGVVPFATLNTAVTGLLAWTPASDGQLAFALDVEQLYMYLAGASTPGWKLIAGKPNTAPITYTGIYSNGGGAQAYQQGDSVGMEGIVTSSSANFTTGNTYTIGTIPTAYAPTADKVFGCLTNVSATAWVTIKSTGTITFSVGVNFTGALNLTLENCQWRPKGY